MKSFRYNTQTALFFGRGILKENAEFFRPYGKRAVIFTSQFYEGCKNRGLEDIKAVFDEVGIEYLVLDWVHVDPPIDVVVELAKHAAEFEPDFYFAVGGGSVIDSCKAAALLNEQPGMNPYEVFYGLGHQSKSIQTEIKAPIFAAPTTAGTGAEVTGFAVLTRADTHTKLSMYPMGFCTAAFVDPSYIEGSPDFLIHTGVIDALAHGVEGCLNVLHTPFSIVLSDYAFSLFRTFKDRMITGGLTTEDYDNMALCSFVQGMAFMQSSTTIPHGMGYPLSHIKGVNHGLSNGIFLGEYVRRFKDQSLVQPIVEKCGFKNSDEFADWCRAITEADVNIEVTEEEIQQWTDDFMKLDFRLAWNPEPLTRDDIYTLYKISLQRYIK